MTPIVNKRVMMRGGVLPTKYAAPAYQPLIGATTPRNAWSKIMGVPICQGKNDIFSDCLTTAAFNASIITAADTHGVRVGVNDQAAVDLFVKLGGLPANIGLDPAVLFNYWADNAIAGFRLNGIHSVALDDIGAQRDTVVATGFLFCTAKLTQAQQTQNEWVPVPNSAPWADHAFLATWFEGPDFYTDTWGEEIPMRNDFLPAQGLNAWRLDLMAA